MSIATVHHSCEFALLIICFGIVVNFCGRNFIADFLFYHMGRIHGKRSKYDRRDFRTDMILMLMVLLIIAAITGDFPIIK